MQQTKTGKREAPPLQPVHWRAEASGQESYSNKDASSHTGTHLSPRGPSRRAHELQHIRIAVELDSDPETDDETLLQQQVQAWANARKDPEGPQFNNSDEESLQAQPDCMSLRFIRG